LNALASSSASSWLTGSFHSGCRFRNSANAQRIRHMLNIVDLPGPARNTNMTPL